MKPLHQSEVSIRQGIQTALDQGSRDAAALGNMLLEADAIRKQVKAAHDKFEAALSTVLTAEQKEKLGSLKMKRRMVMTAPGEPR